MNKVAREDSGCWWGAASLGLLLGALVPACGGSSTEDPPSAAPIAIEALPRKMADAVCENIAGCCRSANIPFELATCRANREAAFQNELDQASTPERRYNAAGAPACLAALSDFYKQCFQTESDDKISAGCRQMFVGTVALGGACTSSDQCAPAADGFGHCLPVPDDLHAPGVCVAEGPSSESTPHGKRGDACNSTCSEVGGVLCAGQEPAGSPSGTACFVAEGLQCDISSRTCQPLVGLGAPCRFAGCAAGGYCTRDNACATVKLDGASCESHEECASQRCVFADDATDGRCSHQPIANLQTCSGASQ